VVNKPMIAAFLLMMLSSYESDEPRIKDIRRFPESRYKGEYIVLRLDQNGFDASLVQEVDWLFSDFKFWMDVTDSDKRPRLLCDAVGYYRLTDANTFLNVVGIFDSCEVSEYPEGAF